VRVWSHHKGDTVVAGEEKGNRSRSRDKPPQYGSAAPAEMTAGGIVAQASGRIGGR
jgi:hypothetical protein